MSAGIRGSAVPPLRERCQVDVAVFAAAPVVSARLPLGVAATYIFIFVLFGAFLESTGAGKFFIDMAYAATGRQRGGPASAAVRRGSAS